ncbi:MAG: TonB-dependent receptor [Bacteroidales bacterium]|nr:TonB-dependent receptor [Bacteroidales bacterium]
MSVFNPDAVKSVQLYKGGFPARFGERLSSVVDIRMKEGNEKEFHGNVSVGLISSKLSLEGPIIKDKTSFVISGRRTYYDILTRPFIMKFNENQNDKTNAGYYFYDLNAKINHKFSEKSRLYLSSYLGRDRAYMRHTSRSSYQSEEEEKRFEYKDDFGLGWGNFITALRWNYLITNKLFSNTTLTFSKYDFDVTIESSVEDLNSKAKGVDYFKYFSGIEDVGAKTDFDYYLSPNHSVKFGAGYTYHHFKPGITTYRFNSGIIGETGLDTVVGDMKVRASEFIMYAEDNIDLTAKLKMNAGVRLSLFNVQDTSYFVFQPRLSLRYMVANDLSFKLSYSKMGQFVHLLTTSAVSLPTDLWLPVTKRYEPPVSHQVALGSGFLIPGDLEVSVEAFYKTMDNLIEYKEGASFGGTGEGWESKVEKGRGWAYGSEIMIGKELRKADGMDRIYSFMDPAQIRESELGNTFPAKYDRRHDVSLALTYKFNDKVDAGLVWVYGTGNAATLGASQYPGDNLFVHDSRYTMITDFPGRNNYRLPSYHRLDLGGKPSQTEEKRN